MFAGPALFSGSLLHRRYFPKRHELHYRVADVLLDVDELPSLNTSTKLFGYNCKRLFSIADRNHGPGDGTAIAVHVRALMDSLQTRQPIKRIFMLCYPAVLGFVFNPITVYFGLDVAGEWQAVVYEVNNTFGQRHSYAMAVQEGCEHIATKQLYVSPFNSVTGEYHFNVQRFADGLRLNISLFENGKLKLCARFDGKQRPFSQTELIKSLLGLMIQPVKVIVGIHWEAAQLYFKGLRPKSKPVHARFSTTTHGDGT